MKSLRLRSQWDQISHIIRSLLIIQYYYYHTIIMRRLVSSHSPVTTKRFYTPRPPAHCTHENTCHVITDINCRACACICVCIGLARWRWCEYYYSTVPVVGSGTLSIARPVAPTRRPDNNTIFM